MFIPAAHAQTVGGAAGADGGLASIIGFAPFILVFIAFYFLMIRPQQRRAKEQQATINAVKKGDSVITAGGVAGKVTKVEERFVEVEIAPTVKVKVVKATIAEVIGSGSAKPAND